MTPHRCAIKRRRGPRGLSLLEILAAVTILGVLNAEPGAVEVVVDRGVWEAGQPLHCHPLVNTATLSVPVDGLQRLLTAGGHPWRIVDVPTRDP